MLRRSLPISASCSLRTGGFLGCDTSNSSSARISPTCTLNSGRSFAPPFLLMFVVLVLLALVVLPVAIAEACLALLLCKQHHHYTHAAPTALKVHLGGFVGAELPTTHPFSTACCVLFSCPGLVFLGITCTCILHAFAGFGIDLPFAAHLAIDFNRDKPKKIKVGYVVRPFFYVNHNLLNKLGSVPLEPARCILSPAVPKNLKVEFVFARII